MAFVPYTNTTGRPITIGTRTVPPHQTRDVDESFIPRAAVAPAADDGPPDMTRLQEQSEASIVKALPGLTPEQLAELYALEHGAASPREAVLALLDRALLNAWRSQSVAAILPDLPNAPDNRLADLRALETDADKPRRTLLEAIDAEILRRKAAD